MKYDANSNRRNSRRRLVASDGVVACDTTLTDDVDSTKKRNLRFMRRFRYGYRKKLLLAVGILGLMVAAGAVCCSKHRRERTLKFLHFDDILTALKVTNSSKSNGSTNEYNRERNSENTVGEGKLPPGVFSSLTDEDRERLRKFSQTKIDEEGSAKDLKNANPFTREYGPYFTNLSSEDWKKLDRMTEDFVKLNSTGKLSPCRLDSADGCFQQIQPYIDEPATKFLRSSPTTDTGGRRIVLHNPLKEGMACFRVFRILVLCNKSWWWPCPHVLHLLFTFILRLNWVFNIGFTWKDRFWCGKRIWGGGTIEITDIPDECKDGKNEVSLSYVYSERPPTIPKKGVFVSADDDSSNAVELFWNVAVAPGVPTEHFPTEHFPCSVPCKVYQKRPTPLQSVRVRNTDWTFTHSMEGERIYSWLGVEATAYRENNFYATTSFKSDIPLPYYSKAEYNIQGPAVDFDKAIKGASFIANNCKSYSNREETVKALIESPLRVDSLSGCLHNADPPPGADMKNKQTVLRQYLFHLAFENQITDDYITEKLWGSLQSGTLPVYLGAGNVKDHAPKNSIINAADFESHQALADYLVKLTKDKDLYESYHKWRYEPLDDAFRDKYEFTDTHSKCRICEWTYAKRHGLGWDHPKQTILKPDIDHKTCRNAMGLIEYPFKESWLSPASRNPGFLRNVMGLIGSWLSSASSGGADIATEFGLNVFSRDSTPGCTLNEESRVIEVDHGAIRRKVYDRDGVTDLVIDASSGGSQRTNDADHYILRLTTPVNFDDTTKTHHVDGHSAWWIQDDDSRVYIMASGPHSLSRFKTLDGTGAIELSIPLPPSGSTTTTTTRVRIVTENVDHFHKDTEDFPSYFGDLMMRDFFEPVASYWYQQQEEQEKRIQSSKVHVVPGIQ